MKLYLAAIDFKKFATKDQDLKSKVKCLKELVHQIVKDAKASLGPNVIVVITMQEYALTPAAISNSDKKVYLDMLQVTVDQYSNLILIPGSFSTYKSLNGHSKDEQETIKRKLSKSYKQHSRKTSYLEDPQFITEYQNTKLKLLSSNLDKYFLLQNSTYLMTANKKRVKHQKSFPWDEKNRLPFEIRELAIYTINQKEPIKSLRVGEQDIHIAVTICREHLVINSQNVNIENPLPFMQVIVSDSVILNHEFLMGLVNIQVDSIDGFSVHYNIQHPNRNLIEVSDIKSICYYPIQEGWCDKLEVDINCFQKGSTQSLQREINNLPSDYVAQKEAEQFHAPNSSNSLQTALVKSTFFASQKTKKQDSQPSILRAKL